MVVTDFGKQFERNFKKIKDKSLKEKLSKIIHKIILSPEIGKPMQYGRKGTRELYIKPFRLSYSYIHNEDRIIFIDIYHKDSQ
ncbi:type II toxin-antitoxin system RelE/ParE family toxin [archaeon]|nr:type II toxin-antitoxin system RelE/ParE family toxin [archaeon]MBL7057082.1 type II toxin-antitoxin system RelE/ParE family toxin [Candidatus Woesearchaeota archaeon]